MKLTVRTRLAWWTINITTAVIALSATLALNWAVTDYLRTH